MKTIEEQNEERRQEFVADLMAKPHPGDSYNFQRLVALGETADYINGHDDEFAQRGADSFK